MRPSRLGGAKLSLDGFLIWRLSAVSGRLPDARIALHVLSGGSTRQMRNIIDSIKDDHALAAA